MISVFAAAFGTATLPLIFLSNEARLIETHTVRLTNRMASTAIERDEGTVSRYERSV